MYVTGRDEAYMSEIRQDRMKDAAEYRLTKSGAQPSPLQTKLQSILGKLGSELQDLWLDSFRGAETPDSDTPAVGQRMAP